jgi:hypothetical protein
MQAQTVDAPVVAKIAGNDNRTKLFIPNQILA